MTPQNWPNGDPGRPELLREEQRQRRPFRNQLQRFGSDTL